MKVGEYIFRKPIIIDENEPVSTAVKIIFNIGISIVPVVKDKYKNRKIKGLITQYDILDKLLPPLKEYIKRLESTDGAFAAIEKTMPEFLTQPVKNIMQTTPITVSRDTPLLKAQSIMLRKKFNRLPVVNSKGHVVGIISQSDVFHALGGSEIPYDTNEEFHQWAAYYYDQIMGLEEKIKIDIPELHKIFERNDVFRVVDVFGADGNRDIALAKHGYHLTGLNRFGYFHRKAQENNLNLPKQIRNKPEFKKIQQVDFFKDKHEDFDAALLMENELAHHPFEYKPLLKSISQSLVKKKAVMILQLANFEKIFKTNNLFQNFNISQSKVSDNVRYGFLEYYDAPVRKGAPVTLNISMYKFGQGRWQHAGMNSTPIAYIQEKDIIRMLKANGFTKIKTYGSNFLEPLFKSPFYPLEHDWLNIVAMR